MSKKSEKVIDLNDHRHDPHISGEAVCMCCRNEWIACAPTGTVDLECPKCHTHKGHFKYIVAKNGYHWQCNCGCMEFAITPDETYCPNCGATQEFD